MTSHPPGAPAAVPPVCAPQVSTPPLVLSPVSTPPPVLSPVCAPPPVPGPVSAPPLGAPTLPRLGWPSVTVIIPTRSRPQLLRQALRSVLAQKYSGALRVIVVYDQCPPEPELDQPGDRPVTVLVNSRTPGLPGSRNTGILAADGDLVAFCDDDDEWAPSKLDTQVRALLATPDAVVATCAIEVEYAGHRTPRLAGRTRVGVAELVRSRMAMLHSSGFLIRREALLTLPAAGGIGLVAEQVPGGQNEDWDLLLRAAKVATITHVDEPLVRVRWGRCSFFAHEYSAKVAALCWMLSAHPEIVACRPGAARVFGQIACWEAAMGNRGAALRWAGMALRRRWHEPRAVIALAATARMVRVEQVLATLHRHGHGI